MTVPNPPAGLLAAIVASSDDAIVSKDLNGYVTSWNRAAERIFGFTADEMIGQHITKVIPADRHSEEDFVLSRVRAGIGVDHFETIRQRKDGELIEVSLTVSPVLNADGRVVGASKIVREMGGRKRMERDAFRLAAIVQSSEDAIVSKDLNGCITSWNPAAERMFGYSPEEAIGHHITLIIPEERVDEENMVLSRIRVGESVEHFETVRRRKDGELIDVSLTISPIRRGNGEVIGASKIARNITEQKRLRLAIEQASRAKDDFLAMLSHELRTPLNTVLGYTRMLQDGVIPESDMSKALGAIGRNADVLTRLVNDVLETSRFVTGKIQLNLQRCDLARIVEEALATIMPAAASKAIAITSHAPADIIVHGDPDRLQQILWNLLSNAVKFTPEGGTIAVCAVKEERWARVSVEDNGMGISPEALPHLFRRFWQADISNSRVHGGLGLGLALARDFAEIHGGSVTAKSQGAGRGARFDVRLPLAM